MDGYLLYWTALSLVLSERARTFHKLLHEFSSVSEIFSASRRQLECLGVDEQKAKLLLSPSILKRAEKEIECIQKKGYTILTFDSPDYPAYLREIFDPPFVLYCAGKIELLQEPAAAIVGARKPTPYGRAVAEKISSDLAARGVVVISGMARGIDTIAHWGALKEGRTIAVLGSGLDNIYPSENHRLFDKIVENGTVITEFPKKAAPLPFHFPLRNRIISGLALAVIVAEATKNSGSLITARLALEFNREVMAVPGSITSELSRGTNWLIKNGAKAVESWRDIVEEFPLPTQERLMNESSEKEPVRPPLRKEEEKLLKHIPTDSAVHIDELAAATEMSIAEILALLLQLEIKELIHPHPGKFYQRKL